MSFRVSVCMAAYNGELYIEEQIRSILLQLSKDDELIIVNDCSNDNTRSIILSFGDPRIRLIDNDINIGHIRTFEKAILIARGDVLFLTDQDDIWVAGRLESMLSALLESQCPTVATNFYIFDRNISGATRNKKRLPSSSGRLNIFFKLMAGKVPYYGCCMAFRKELLDIFLPIPKFVESHDIWLAWVSIFSGGICHLKKESLFHRVHSENLTPRGRRSIFKVAKTRAFFLWMNFIIAKRKLCLLLGV